MQITGNTILITGGGSGIGRALAEAFHAEGNQVVIAGRRKELLDETTAANPGMKSVIFDIGNGNAIPSFADKLKGRLSGPERRHPQCGHHAAGVAAGWRS